MIKAFFTKLFNEAIKPFNKRLTDVEEKIDTGFDANGIKTGTADKPNSGDAGNPFPRKPLIAKSVALNNLAEYIKGFETAKGMMAGRQVGSEIEFYERNNKTLKTEVLHGVAAIEGFIARARKDEVRLVRQVR